MSRRSTSILKTAFLKKVVNLTISFLELFCPHRGGHGTPLKCRDSSWRLLWCPPRIFKTSFGGLGGPQGTPTKGEIAPSSLLPSAVESPNRIPAFLQGIMPPRGLLPCKNAGILAAHGTPLKCRESGLLPSTGHFGPPSDDLDASKHFFKKAFQLRTFFLAAFWLPSRWPRDTVEMQ